jgi:hypothetical protein
LRDTLLILLVSASLTCQVKAIELKSATSGFKADEHSLADPCLILRAGVV